MTRASSPLVYVGIFWVTADGDRMHPIIDRTPLHLAQRVRDVWTSPIGHAEHWAALQRLSARTLQRWLATTAPLNHPYDAWPRGRLDLHDRTRRFIVHMDARLYEPRFTGLIQQAFALSPSAYDLCLNDQQDHGV